MNNSPLQGVIVPAITPVDDEDRVDEAAFRAGLRRLIAGGVDGIFVGGSAGEGPLLTDREWERMAGIAADEVRGDAPLLGGAMDASTPRVLHKLRLLARLGYAHAVVTPTYYLTLRHPDEYLRLFGACVEAAGEMEIVAYNIPPCTGSILPAETVVAMARRGWIRTIKDSSGDFDYLCRLLAEGAEHGLRVLQGDELAIGEGLRAGAVGIVPVGANYDLGVYRRACRAASDGDEAAMGRCMARIMALRQALVLAGPQWIAGVKYALSQLGIGSGKPISPLQPLTPAQRAAVDAFMAAD